MSEEKKTSKDTKASEPEPNIIFVGEKGQEERGYMNGTIKVTLPEKDQDKGFYHERASEIVRVFGTEKYKFLKPKGRK